MHNIIKQFITVLLFFGLIFILNCEDEKEDDSKECTINGTSVNIGSTTGGTFSTNFDSTHTLVFNNTNLNFLVSIYDSIEDVGSTDCLEEIDTWNNSTSTTVAALEGHGYIIKFHDGTYCRFIAGSYSQGSFDIEYEYPFNPN